MNSSPINNPFKLWKQMWLVELGIIFSKTKSISNVDALSTPSCCNIKTKEKENFNQEEETQWTIELFFMSHKISSPTMPWNILKIVNVCVKISATTKWWRVYKDMWRALKQNGVPSNAMYQYSSACMDLWRC